MIEAKSLPGPAGPYPAALTMELLGRAGVIAVVRAPSAEAALRTVDAVVRGGVTAVEITYSTPDVPAVLRQLGDAYGDRIVLGAGTVTQLHQVEVAAESGARFLVSPGLVEDVANAMMATGLATLLGAFTPSEVMRVQETGAQAVKLFPASTGGIDHLRALRGPFPDLRLVPTGGVTADNVQQWLAAGAFAVGAAGSLCPGAAMSVGDYDEIYRRAIAFHAAVRASRESPDDSGPPVPRSGASA